MSDDENQVEEQNPEDSFEKEEKAREEANTIWQCFMQFDAENQGHISTNDLKSALDHLGEDCNDR